MPPDTPGMPGRTRAVTCPSCGGSVAVRANGISISVVCGSCGSTLDVANPDVRLITAANAPQRQPAIPLGKRGVLAGIEWEVVGYQNRGDVVEGWTWDEYLLFNPYHGFTFLARDDESWTLYRLLREDVGDPESGFEGRRYAQTSASTVRTHSVLGEFYWRAKAGDQASVVEYVNGSDLLSREQTNDEIIWSRGLRLPRAMVEAAFGSLPKSTGDEAPADETTADVTDWSSLVQIIGLISVIVVLLAYVIPFGSSPGAIVFDQTFHTTALDRGKTLTSEPFEIPGSGGNVRITVRAPVDNDWAELDMTLVAADDTAYSAISTIEYWHGYDSDGAWTEGSLSDSEKLTGVKGGTYRLLVEPYAGAFDADRPSAALSVVPARYIDFQVTIIRHARSLANLLVALLLLIPYPAWRFYVDWTAAARVSQSFGRGDFS